VKLAAILSTFGNRSDRFLTSGYASDRTMEEQFDLACQVPELEGVELVGTWHLTPESVEEVKQHLGRTGLQPVSVIPNLFGHPRFGRGAFTAHDPGIRRQAIDETKLLTDLARQIGCDTVCIWPGQDGYDYPLQYDYAQAFEWFVEGLRECVDHASDIRFALEYKPKEPRNRSFASTVDRTLLLVNAVNRSNVGVTLDTGHALVGYENPGESVALLQLHARKLFHVHLNDNYRLWDDDLIFGAVHPVEMLEFIYWLGRTDYDSWCSFDQYPYREDPVRAIAESVRWYRVLEAAVVAGRDELGRALESGDAILASRLVRELLAGAGSPGPILEASQ
jgi:xylose isomerase